MTRLDLLSATERETLKFRLLALLVFSLAVFLRIDEVSVLLLVGLIASYLVYSAILRTVLIPRFASYWLLGFMMLVDAAAIITGVYLIGVNSPVIILIPISVVYFGLYQGYVSALTMAIIVSFGFTGVIYVTGRLEEMVEIIAIQVPSSFLLALLIGYLAQARFRESEEYRAQQQVIQTEAQGRRLLQIVSLLREETWQGLDAETLAQTAAQMGQMPWAALIDADSDAGETGENHVRLVGASYTPVNGASVPKDALEPLIAALAASGNNEVETTDRTLPEGWLPTDGTPGYLWAYLVNNTPLRLFCIMGPAGTARPDASTRRSLRAFAPLSSRVMEVRQLFEQTERRSRDLAGEIRSTVAFTSRLTETQTRRSLQFGHFSIDPQRERIRLGTAIVHLSQTEFDLLYTLASNAGSVYNTETLLRTVWGPDYAPQGKPVDVAIHRLRRKLDTFPGGARLIRTVRGRGYTFVRSEASALPLESHSP